MKVFTCNLTFSLHPKLALGLFDLKFALNNLCMKLKMWEQYFDAQMHEKLENVETVFRLNAEITSAPKS